MTALISVHYLFLSISFALFAAAAAAEPNLEDVVKRLTEVETKLKASEKEISFLLETSIYQKKVIENQDTRIQALEKEVAGQRDMIRTDREKQAAASREISGLRHKLRTILNKRITLETQLKKKTSLKNETKSSAQNSGTIQRRAVGVGVAFTAYMDHDADLGTDQVLKYNKVILNEGNDYNPYTGFFTWSQAGVYLFTFFIGERSETNVAKQMWADLVVNGQRMISAFAETSHITEDAQGGNTVVLRLKHGDSVWVKSDGSNHHVEGSSARVTSFTGLYLYP